MSVCHAASIGIDQDVIEYNGPNGAHWRVPMSRVRVLGEYRSAQDDRGTLLAIVFDDSGAWLQAPRNAIGADSLLQKLFKRWGTAPDERAAPLMGRILWPQELAGEPLFDDTCMQLSVRVSQYAMNSSRLPPTSVDAYKNPD